MSLRNLIMFFVYIREMSKCNIILLLNKIGINRKDKIENKNSEILDDYYNENYDLDRQLEEEYLGKYYNGYEVEDGNTLIYKKNMSIEEERDFFLVEYKFSLPIHEEVLNKLEINIDRSKYKFIYISLLTKNNLEYNRNDNEYCGFLNNFFEEINFIFIYESIFIENIKINKEGSRGSYELLLCVNSENLIKVMNVLNYIEQFKKYKCVIKEVDDEIEFFKGNYLLKQFKDNEISSCNAYTHVHHEFLVYKLDEKLEDYYILGNYINSFDSMEILNYVDLINVDLYARQYYSLRGIEEIDELDEPAKIKIEIENKIEKKKRKIYKKIKNKYLKRTYGHYVLLHISLLAKFKYKIKLFLNNIKNLKVSNVLYSMGVFKANSYNEFVVFNNSFKYFNDEIIARFKIDNSYDDIEARYQKFLKKHEQAIDNVQMDFELSKKASFENNHFNWESIKSIGNYKNMLNNMNKCSDKNDELFNQFLIKNRNINNTLRYGEDYKSYNLNEVSDSTLFRKYNVEVWDRKKLLDEVDFNVDRIEDTDIQKGLKHLVLSIKNEDKIIFYPLTHSEYLRIDINILKQQILKNKNIDIDEEVLNRLIREFKQIRSIKIQNIELYKYTHNKETEVQFRTGKSFECTKRNEVLIPEPNNKNIIEKYNENHECLTTSHNLRMNLKNIKEDNIYSMFNDDKVEYIFSPENNGLRKCSEILNYLKEYFII